MRLRVIAIAALAILALSVFAYAAPAVPGRLGGAPPMIKQQLGLTDQQSTQIRDIVRKYRADTQGVLKSSATKDQKKTQIGDLRTKASDAIMAVLTPDQQAKAKQTGVVDRLLSRGVARQMRFERAVMQLNLTDAQKTQVRAIFRDARTQGEAIRGDTSLTQDQRQAKLKALGADTHTKVLGVLTPDQQQKLKDLLAKEPKGGE